MRIKTKGGTTYLLSD